MGSTPGFIHPSVPSLVYQLKRSLYGLKQPPRAWFDHFSLFFHRLGFFCWLANSSLFIMSTSGILAIVLVYVDDIIVVSNNNLLLIQVSSCNHFELKDLYFLYFLGIFIFCISFSLQSNVLIICSKMPPCFHHSPFLRLQFLNIIIVFFFFFFTSFSVNTTVYITVLLVLFRILQLLVLIFLIWLILSIS